MVGLTPLDVYKQRNKDYMKILRRRRAKIWRKKITLLPLLKSHLWPLHDIWDSKT